MGLRRQTGQGDHDGSEGYPVEGWHEAEPTPHIPLMGAPEYIPRMPGTWFDVHITGVHFRVRTETGEPWMATKTLFGRLEEPSGDRYPELTYGELLGLDVAFMAEGADDALVLPVDPRMGQMYDDHGRHEVEFVGFQPNPPYQT